MPRFEHFDKDGKKIGETRSYEKKYNGPSAQSVGESIVKFILFVPVFFGFIAVIYWLSPVAGESTGESVNKFFVGLVEGIGTIIGWIIIIWLVATVVKGARGS